MFQDHDLPGLFVVVEGTDGAGTTSITNALTVAMWKRFNLYPGQTSEPTDPEGAIGSLIRDMLNKKGFSSGMMPEPVAHADLDHFNTILRLLFAADRFDHINRTINPILEEGRPLFCDRYVYSSMVYQGDWGGPVLPEHKKTDSYRIKRVVEANRGIIKPDLVLFLDVDGDVAFDRVNKRNEQTRAIYEERDVFETREKVTRHAEIYRRVFDIMEFNGLNAHFPVKRIDANQPFDDVLESCLKHVKPLL